VRTCSLCSRTDRAAIDEAIAAGRDSLAQLASRFESTKATIDRHSKHLAGKIAAAKAVTHTALLAEGATLAEKLLWIIREADRLKSAAEEAKDYRTALQGLREIVRVLELVADVERAGREASSGDIRTMLTSLTPEERRERLQEMKFRVLELEEELDEEAPARLPPMRAVM
jgi:hypothetical protein